MSGRWTRRRFAPARPSCHPRFVAFPGKRFDRCKFRWSRTVSIAQPDQRQPQELSHIEDFGMTETGCRSSDAGKNCSNGDQDHSDESVLLSRLPEPDCRDDCAADQKDACIQVDEWTECANPLPHQHFPSQAMRLHECVVDWREKDATR